MRTTMHFVICLLLTFALSSCAVCTGGWTPKDTAMELASEGILAVDWHQTQQIAKQPERFYEHNPILGVHPSIAKVNTYFIGWMVLHPFVSCALPPGSRFWWQALTIGVEGKTVVKNHEIGLKP